MFVPHQTDMPFLTMQGSESCAPLIHVKTIIILIFTSLQITCSLYDTGVYIYLLMFLCDLHALYLFFFMNLNEINY